MLALNTRLQFFSFWHVLEEAQPSREPLAGTSRNADVMRVNSTKTFRSLGNGRLAIILGFCLSALAACQRAETDAPAPAAAVDLGTISVGEEVASFYRERGFKPLWFKGRELKPDANLLFRKIGEAALHGVDPAQYEPERLRQGVEAAKGQNPKIVAQTELLLSRAYTRLAVDLRRAPQRNQTLYVDAELKPTAPAARELLDRLAADEPPAVGLSVNPLYDRLAAGFARYFERWGSLPQVPLPAGVELRPGMSGEAIRLLRRRFGLAATDTYDEELLRAVRDFEAVHGLPADGLADRATIEALNRGYRHYERIIQANLERARGIRSGSDRFVLVDTAGTRLWLFDGGKPVDSMKVIVGKHGMETPEMAAFIRYVTLNPYWNVPPDLIRNKVAMQVLKRGPGYVPNQRLQVLSDWSPSARLLDPAKVDWRAVAAGRQLVQVRQLPGAGNVMGRMKFMFPNKLGIYLHDTPERALFGKSDRRISSGCVRVEDAERLGRWLFGGAVPAASGAPEQKVPLPEQVPVHILHLTAIPGAGGIRFQPDTYGRDARLAQLSTR
jgi:murein L,D-transpeptidase YcbB/YkuD